MTKTRVTTRSSLLTPGPLQVGGNLTMQTHMHPNIPAALITLAKKRREHSKCPQKTGGSRSCGVSRQRNMTPA